MLGKIALILGVCGVGTIFFSSYLVRIELASYQREEIEQITKVVMSGVESTNVATATIERQIDQKLLTASMEIAEALRGKTIDEITKEELLRLKDRLGLYGISLYVRQDDDIVIAQSSEEQEVGLNAKDWGYWYTAFDQLMSGNAVTVNHGYASRNYWAGPIAKSEWAGKYYKYAYYYDGTTPFMIDPYILDLEIHSLTFQSGTTQMIEKIVEESGVIDEIAVVNAPAWLKGDNVVLEPITDQPVLYGTNAYAIPQDEMYFKSVMETGSPAVVTFLWEGERLKKYYRPLPDQRVMTVVVNTERHEQFKRMLTTLLSIAFIVVFAVIFLIIRAVARKQLRPLRDITDHFRKVAEGNLSQTLRVDEANEWGWLSAQINDVTRNISGLILGIKKDADSIYILSSLLAKRVYASLDTMNEVSVSMTHEAKASSVELYARIEAIQRSLQATEAGVVNEQLEHLSGFWEAHANNVTSITIMLHDALQELKEAIERMDELSLQLKRKMERFDIDEEKH